MSAQRTKPPLDRFDRKTGLTAASIVKAGSSEGPEHMALIGRCEKTFLGVVALMLHSHGCPINLSVLAAIFQGTALSSRVSILYRLSFATTCMNGRFSRRVATSKSYQSRKTSRCERMQHKIDTSGVGSKLTCGGAALDTGPSSPQRGGPDDRCQPKADMAKRILGRIAYLRCARKLNWAI